MSQEIESSVKALGVKKVLSTEDEVEFIKLQALAASRGTTYNWVV